MGKCQYYSTVGNLPSTNWFYKSKTQTFVFPSLFWCSFQFEGKQKVKSENSRREILIALREQVILAEEP